MKIGTLTLVAVLGALAVGSGCATPGAAGAAGNCNNALVVPYHKQGGKHRPGFSRCDDGRIVAAAATSAPAP